MAPWASAPPQDQPFVAELERALARRGTRLDEVLVFVVSPESVRSQECLAALDQALARNAAIVPLLRRELAGSELPPALLPLAQIPFRESDSFAAGVDALIARLGADLRFDVFISYARGDAAAVDQLVQGLWRAGKTTWVDRAELLASEQWRKAILGGIEAADHFVFLISPRSVASEFCSIEVAHAVTQNKRIIPVLLAEVDRARLPPAVAERQWVVFDVGDLVRALEVDPEWTRTHTELLRRANAWELGERDDAALLRGSELQAAERWLTTAGESTGRNPTALQTEFILASRSATTSRLRKLIGGVTTALAVSVALAVTALFFWRQQKAETRRALANAAEAHVEEALRRGAPNEALAWAALVPPTLGNADRVARALQVGSSHTLIPETDDRHHGAMAWSGDSRRFAFGDSDGTIAVWSVADGRLTRLGKAAPPMEAEQAARLAFGADGNRLAAQGRGGTVTLWDLRDKSAVELDEGLKYQGDQGALGWSGTRLLATAGGRACAWSVVGAKPALIRCRYFGGHQCAFAPVGSKLLCIAGTGEQHVWDVDLDTVLQIEGPRAASGGFSSDGSRVVIGTRDRRLVTYRLTAGGAETLLTSQPVPNRLRPGEVDMQEDENEDASRFSIDRRIRQVEWSRRDEVAYLFGGAVGVWSPKYDNAALLTGDTAETLAWSPDGSKLARAESKGLVRLFQLDKGYGDRRERTVAGEDPSLAWSPSGRYLAIVAKDAPLELWDTESVTDRTIQKSTTFWDADFKEERTRTFDEVAWFAGDRGLAARAWPAGVGIWAADGSRSETFAVGKGRDRVLVAPSPSEATLAYVGGDGNLHLRGLDGKERVIRGIDGPATLLAWSPQGKVVAWGDKTRLALWSLDRQKAEIVTGSKDIGALAWSPDGQRLASATFQGLVELRDARGRTVETLGTPNGNPTRIALAWPRQDALVVAFHEQVLRILDPTTKRSWQIDGYVDLVQAWSPSGELAVGDWSGVRFYTVTGASARPALPVRFKEPNQRVGALAWSPDGKLLALGADAGTIEVVDVRERERCTLWGHTEAVTSLAWDRAGDTIVSSALDGTVRAWPALWKQPGFRNAIDGRSNWIVGDDLVARPRPFAGLPAGPRP